MAVVFVFRAGVLLTPLAYRVLRASEGPGAEQVTGIPGSLWARINDPGESSGDLELALGEATGRMWSVTDYTGTFELRKAQVRWGRSGGAAGGTDDAVTTHHFIKIAGGAPSGTWVEADFTGLESALAGFWSSIKDAFTPNTIYKQVRWYRVVPGTTSNGAPVRVIDPNVPGTAPNTQIPFPPQVAVSVTERTSDVKSWGRFYLPNPGHGNTTAFARIHPAFQDQIANAADTLYEAAITNGTPTVVFSAAKPARPSAGGGTLPATSARALGVLKIQVDDLYDVIRSRRWNEPLLRVQREVAGA
jgi:hypothetical protein